jgi:hypothetical protein
VSASFVLGSFTATVGLCQVLNFTVHPLTMDVDSDPRRVIALLHESSQVLVLLAVAAGLVNMRGIIAGQVIQVV